MLDPATRAERQRKNATKRKGKDKTIAAESKGRTGNFLHAQHYLTGLLLPGKKTSTKDEASRATHGGELHLLRRFTELHKSQPLRKQYEPAK